MSPCLALSAAPFLCLQAQVSSQIKVRDLSRCTVTASPAQYAAFSNLAVCACSHPEILLQVLVLERGQVGVDDRGEEAAEGRRLPSISGILQFCTQSHAPHFPSARQAQLAGELAVAADEAEKTSIRAEFDAREVRMLHICNCIRLRNALTCAPPRSQRILEHELDHTPRELALSLQVAYNFLSKWSGGRVAGSQF